MFVKRGKVDIVSVIEDHEHNIDDEGTREEMKRAAQVDSAPIEKPKVEEPKLEN